MLRASSSLGELARTLCVDAGFEPTIAFESDDLSTLRGFVAAGLGIAIVPLVGVSATDGLPSPLCYVPLTERRATQEIGLSWSVRRKLLPSAELFKIHLASLAASDGLPAPAQV